MVTIDEIVLHLLMKLNDNFAFNLVSETESPREEELRPLLNQDGSQDVREEAQGSDIPPQGQVCIEMSER